MRSHHTAVPTIESPYAMPVKALDKRWKQDRWIVNRPAVVLPMLFIMPRGRPTPRCVVLVVMLAMAATGCGAQMHERLRTAPPLTVGLVIGHDVNAITSLTTGEEMLVALSLGLIGLGIAEATAEKQVLPFEAELRVVVVGKLVSQLAAKGYRAQLVAQKPKKWVLLENLSADAYGSLLKAHALEDLEARKFDSVLFVEYWVEGRLEGRFLSSPQAADLELKRMRPKYAKSKLFLYDTSTGTRLYSDQTQRGYPTFTDATLATALETIINLEALPAR